MLLRSYCPIQRLSSARISCTPLRNVMRFLLDRSQFSLFYSSHRYLLYQILPMFFFTYFFLIECTLANKLFILINHTERFLHAFTCVAYMYNIVHANENIYNIFSATDVPQCVLHLGFRMWQSFMFSSLLSQCCKNHQRFQCLGPLSGLDQALWDARHLV